MSVSTPASRDVSLPPPDQPGSFSTMGSMSLSSNSSQLSAAKIWIFGFNSHVEGWQDVRASVRQQSVITLASWLLGQDSIIPDASLLRECLWDPNVSVALLSTLPLANPWTVDAYLSSDCQGFHLGSVFGGHGRGYFQAFYSARSQRH